MYFFCPPWWRPLATGLVPVPNILQLQAELPDKRKEMVRKVFAAADTNHDGVITAKDLIELFDVSQRAEFIDGVKTKEELLAEFLNDFKSGDNKNGEVSNKLW